MHNDVSVYTSIQFWWMWWFGNYQDLVGVQQQCRRRRALGFQTEIVLEQRVCHMINVINEQIIVCRVLYFSFFIHYNWLKCIVTPWNFFVCVKMLKWPSPSLFNLISFWYCCRISLFLIFSASSKVIFISFYRAIVQWNNRNDNSHREKMCITC